uniref:NADH-ubiquinone oxidoreductase chain 2 n=1 Tax=Pelomedusa subrufa TaxID=44522 RepID=NU2M_PELSU|nr:NADH dehydrogenase subunit 2 [Pelomedusa subrufa]O79671.1 RecName: Full=NADH-ubiquinone oxidoreductase chain 2; AltName: Full=NADH dehydrogenase subunit 2 [Pelomedusa subrufa]AAD05051.1 NADH dehydrogenase subunit 2 [Pelomedusa subrufa]
MNPYVRAIITSGLILGPIITMSSNHWITAWCGLEMNSLTMIPLIANKYQPRAIEASTKYFLTQAMASYLMLSAALMNMWYYGQWDMQLLTDNISCTTMTVAMSIKLAAAPFHFWFPEVLQGATVLTALLLTTWQKLAPLTILVQCSQNLDTTLLIALGMTSILIGGWGGLNQTQIRKIMAFSSIAHLGWMYAILTLSPKILLLTFYLYVAMTATTFLMINVLQTNNMSAIMISWTKTPFMNTMMLLNLMSLAGLPPLTGFAPKWLILQEFTKQRLSMFASMMITSSLLSLYFYLRMSYYTIITLPPTTCNYPLQWRLMTNIHTALATITPLATALMPLLPTLKAIP